MNIVSRMTEIANEHNIEFNGEFFDYMEYFFKEPKERVAEWYNAIKQLQVLQNMRVQAIVCDESYDAELIDYILEECMDELVIYDIGKDIIDWDEVARRHRERENC